MNEAVRRRALEIAEAGDGLPAYVYDLGGLAAHAERVAEALAGAGVEFFYAAKANPDAEILRTLAPFLAGVEVASGGELAHVRAVLPEARIAFGGPGKTDPELALALELGVERLHVESPYELERLIRIAAGRPVDVLLRANLPIGAAGAALSMSGPFGMDEAGLAAAVRLLTPNVRLRGLHTHLASGLDAPAMVGLGGMILERAVPWLGAHAPEIDRPEVVLGGGMGADYADPPSRFDWAGYAAGVAGLPHAGEVRLRVEPGRAVSVYDGFYVTDVIDVKTTHGRAFAVLRGGTHHLRTPATKNHSQPCVVVQQGLDGPSITGDVTFVGQLCTPKDVLAVGVAVTDLRPGDLVVFGMAGAYAWNISHHDFLMHPKPSFHYLGTNARSPAQPRKGQ